MNIPVRRDNGQLIWILAIGEWFTPVFELPLRSRRGASPRLPLALCAALVLAATSGGCILTTDLPDPALDIPANYKAAPAAPEIATPSLDWWRGFRSQELTVLMEEAQTVNLDIAAAVARIRQADALAQTAGATLLPNVTGTFSGSRSRSSSNTGVVT